MTCLRVIGYQTLKGLNIQIQVVQQFPPQKTVSGTEGQTKISLIGDGNQTNVIFQGLMLRPFWKLLEEKPWHS